MTEDKRNATVTRDERAQLSASDQVEDARLQALLVRFGGDYNRPPDIVPHEEMWHAIRQTRVSPAFIHRHPAWSVLAAAVLLLGVGVGIGIDMHSRLAGPVHFVAELPPGVAAPGTQLRGTDGGVQRSAQNVTNVPPRQQSSGVSVAPPARSYASAGADARSTAYTLATVRHFTAVEALLTTYQTSPHDARGDAQMAAWSRALLSQTRLLIDSPAGVDPVRRKLLQDLELILVQMSQLSPSDAPIDREMIDGSVRKNDVITRLRTAVPAGGATHL